MRFVNFLYLTTFLLGCASQHMPEIKQWPESPEYHDSDLIDTLHNIVTCYVSNLGEVMYSENHIRYITYSPLRDRFFAAIIEEYHYEPHGRPGDVEKIYYGRGHVGYNNGNRWIVYFDRLLTIMEDDFDWADYGLRSFYLQEIKDFSIQFRYRKYKKVGHSVDEDEFWNSVIWLKDTRIKGLYLFESIRQGDPSHPFQAIAEVTTDCD